MTMNMMMMEFGDVGNGEEGEEIERQRMEIDMARGRETHINDIPEVIMSNIFSAIKETRSRNRMALVCKKWHEMERATRVYLCIRGNIRNNLYLLPMCFQSVTKLDLSLCSPWGYPPLDFTTPHGHFIGHRLKQAFPKVNDIVIYVRNARNIEKLSSLWPCLEHVKLVRWHRRALDPESAVGLGMELKLLMQNCTAMKSLDLSQFYCWTEDIPLALQAEPNVSANLSSLNLLKLSAEGFRTQELAVISGACRNLEEFFAVCVFDPRYMDCVGDEALVTLARNCSRVRILHLVDATAFGALRGDPEESFSSGNAKITRQGLENMFWNLPLLEDLVLDISQNVPDSGPALEFLSSQCKNITSLKLGQFHGVCKGPQPDGVALCANLEALFIKNCADLSDTGLAAIAVGCSRLGKLELQGCKQITEMGLSFCTSRLSKTLVEVRVSCCKCLDTAATLRALEPICESVRKLHIDCIWDKSILDQEIAASSHMLNPVGTPAISTREMTSYGMGKNQLVSAGDCSANGWDQNPKCAWGPSLQLAPPQFCPDLNCANLDFGSSPSDVQMTNWSLDLNLSASSCSEPLESSEERGCLPREKFFKGHEEANSLGFDRYVPSDSVMFRGMDVNGKAPQMERQFYSNTDTVSDLSSMGFVDFLGINDKHQEWPKFGADINYSMEVMGNSSQIWGMAGEASKRTSSANIEDEQLYKKKCMYSLNAAKHCAEIPNQNSCSDSRSHIRSITWKNLKFLSLWIPVGELLSPLAAMGLKVCPVLEEITIQVEGDCRLCPKPRERACGLSSLACYPSLSKLELNCGEVIGFALSAPAGNMDLSLWERWYLNGLRELRLSELNYWPPQDKDMNRRGLSLPAAGLLSECATLRKLFVHGTAHEHFMMMFVRIPELRDVQLREDYYPAHEDDTSTEMRTDSCRRFEEALVGRGFTD